MKQSEVEAIEKEVRRKFKEPILISVLIPKMSDVIITGDKSGVRYERKIMKLECMVDFAKMQSAIREGTMIPYPEGWMQVFTWLLNILDFYKEDEETGEEKKDG